MSIPVTTILSLAPVFKDSVGKVIESGADVVSGYGDMIKSYGRGMENIMSAVGDRIRGGPRPM